MPLDKIPHYSTEPHCEVYHNHTDCTEANNIEKRYFKLGTGGKRLCHHCEKLANQDALIQECANYSFSKGGLASGLIGGLGNSSDPIAALFASKG